MRNGIASNVGHHDVGPRLPSFEEFAELISRPAHSDLSETLYRVILSSHVELADKLPGSLPKSGAEIDLPVLPPALKRPAHWAPAPHAQVGQALKEYLVHSNGNPQPDGVVFREARHFERPVGVPDVLVGPAAGIRSRGR